MTKQQTTMYFDVDVFKTWLIDKKIDLTFESKNKVTHAVELAKLNQDKIADLQKAIEAFLDESLDGPVPPSVA
jgi:hypothetical protein